MDKLALAKQNFYYAVQRGDIDEVKAALDQRPLNTRAMSWALELAVSIHDSEMARLLLDNGADICVLGNESSSLNRAAAADDVEMVELLLGYSDTSCAMNPALVQAVISNAVDAVRYLLEKGANVRFNGDCCACIAVRNGSFETLELLLDYGVDPHADSYFPIRWAASRNYIEIVNLLLEHDRDHPDIQTRACQAAFDYGLPNELDYAVMVLLVEHGADYTKLEGFESMKRDQVIQHFIALSVGQELLGD